MIKRWHLLAAVGLGVLVFHFSARAASPASGEGVKDGAALYATHCASCHDGTVSKAPPLTLLQIMTGSSVLRAMESGVMRSHAAAMSPAERRVLAHYLTGMDPQGSTAGQLAPRCTAGSFDPNAPRESAGWGVTLDNQRHHDDSITSLRAASLPQLELKWAFAYPEALRARSQPAVAGNTLFVGSQNGTVYALDRATGCIRWTFSTIAEVRTGIVVSPWELPLREPPLIFFGDLVGNVYAVNAMTGELAWRDRPDDHPSLTLTAAPALHAGTLYVPLSSLEVTEAADPNYACCTFRGGVAAYEAQSGKKRWVGYTIDTPPRVVGENAVGTDRIAPSGAPVWNTPAIDPKRGRLYVGTGENYSSPANETSDAIVALNLADGSIAWHRQMTPGDAWNMGCETEARINCPPEDGPDYDFGAATIIATTPGGRDLLLAGQKSGEVFALDPDRDGEILWRQKLGRGGIQGGVHFGMAVDGDTLYVPMSDFDGGPRWPGTPRPGMFALNIATGGVHWYTPAADRCEAREFCQPGISAPASSLPGGVVAGAMDGWLRAYDGRTGEVLWEYDTAVEFDTLGGGRAHGGSFGGASGPVFSGDMLFVNSGYGIYFHMPGNVLLAFGPRD
jgi:polyvinyl alcohol dehydrogenase (cytochrome)